MRLSCHLMIPSQNEVIYDVHRRVDAFYNTSSIRRRYFFIYTAVKYRCLSIKNQSRGTKKGWNSLLFKRKVWYGNPSTVDAAAGDTSIIPWRVLWQPARHYLTWFLPHFLFDGTMTPPPVALFSHVITCIIPPLNYWKVLRRHLAAIR